MLVFIALSASALGESVLVQESTKAYRLPSTSAKSVSVSAGVVLEKTAEQNGWIRVERGGKTAYLRADSVIDVKQYGGASGYIREAAPMYKTYGKSAKYGALPAGTEVSVYAVAGEWAYVGYAGCKGYVRKASLSTEKPESDRDEVVITKGKSAYVAIEGAKVYKNNSVSSKALAALPINTKLNVGAVCGDWAFVGLNGSYGFMQLSNLSNEKQSAPAASLPSEDSADAGDKVSASVPESADLGKSNAVPAKGRAQAMDWYESDIQTIFARNVSATITDVATGIAWKVVRKGGSSHADVQPMTAADTAAMKAAVGNWSWNRRAIFVTIDGVNYAASMNSMPHGSGSIRNNNYNGHHCIHFTNSRGHSSNQVCPLHQSAIQKALNAKL